MLIPSYTYLNTGVGIHKGEVEKDEKGKSYIMRFAQNLTIVMKKTEE